MPIKADFRNGTDEKKRTLKEWGMGFSRWNS